MDNNSITIVISIIATIISPIVPIFIKSSYFYKIFDKHSFSKSKYDELFDTIAFCLDGNNSSSLKQIKVYKYKTLFDNIDLRKVLVRGELLKYFSQEEIDFLFFTEMIKYYGNRWLLLPSLKRTILKLLILITLTLVLLLVGCCFFFIILNYLYSFSGNIIIFIALNIFLALTLACILLSVILYFYFFNYLIIALYIFKKVRKTQLKLVRFYYDKNDYKELCKYF